MAKADNAQVTWETQKKSWQIRIRVGAEVIRRPAASTAADAAEEALRSMAVKVAQDEGYDLDPSKVTITR
jgi:hypothetical protein